MGTQTIWEVRNATMGLRHLLLGRVLLKEDCLEGDDEIVVGRATNEFNDGRSGVLLFKGNGTTVKLVQPPTTIGGTDGYEETVTIEALSGDTIPLNLAFSTGTATNDYTVAGGAYVEMGTRPTAVSDLRLLSQDLTLVSDESLIKLPAIHVKLNEGVKEHMGGPNWQLTYEWECRYYRQRSPGEDFGDESIDDFTEILNQVESDSHCGGELDQLLVRSFKRADYTSSVLGPVDIWSFLVWGQVFRNNPKALPED